MTSSSRNHRSRSRRSRRRHNGNLGRSLCSLGTRRIGTRVGQVARLALCRRFPYRRRRTSPG